jgi:hypothetical protein
VLLILLQLTMTAKTVENKRRHIKEQIEPRIPLITDIESGNKKTSERPFVER